MNASRPQRFAGLVSSPVGVKLRVHRRAFFPDDFAGERELREVLQLLIAGDVEELLVALGAHFEAVAAALKLIAERAHEFARADRRRRSTGDPSGSRVPRG